MAAATKKKAKTGAAAPASSSKRKTVKKSVVRIRTPVVAQVGALVRKGEEATRRAVLKSKLKEKPNYFASSENHNLQFVSSGCCVLDNVLGGGYVLGRMANIVGDKSSGKTLLAIEASANFINRYKNGEVWYAEAEAAFDAEYAGALGMPLNKVKFRDKIETVEDFFEDIELACKQSTKNKPILYVLDSMDAISSRTEQTQKIDEGSYNLNKQKKLGELFRRKIKALEESHVGLIIISQIRDKIGVTFGETKMRTGGKSLDFYASQILWLSEIQKLKKTIAGVERVVGIQVKANCKKNKVGLPFRTCEFPVLFGYGVDDMTANVEWLLASNKEGRLKELELSKAGYKIRIHALRNDGGEEMQLLREALNVVVQEEWTNIETSFLPKSKKY
jgi:protein RecA